MTTSPAVRRRWDYAPAAALPLWPEGKRLALYVAVGMEHYDLVGGMTENLLPDVPAPDLVNASWRDYGNRVGAYRLLERLHDFGIPPTVLLNTALYDKAPDLMAAVRTAGAEVVGHGVSNSDTLTDLSPSQEQAYLERVSRDIEQREGNPPGGWSSPWLAHSPNTCDLLTRAGYRYLLDLRLDDAPVWLTTSGGPLLSIPYALELNDSSSMIGRQVSPTDFADMIIDEYEELHLAAQDRPLVMSIVVHSFISGAPFRLAQLSRALHHLSRQSANIWFTQPRHIYKAVSRRSLT